MTVESVLSKVSESTGIPVEVITGHWEEKACGGPLGKINQVCKNKGT